ncbi:MAG: DegV family protein [Anaerolineales bacterium]|jgi:DegV family protein with EDD domain
MIRIVTDGAADMPLKWLEEFDINVIPINIHFGEKTYLQNVDLDRDGFYQLVDETRKIPKTSQPTPHQFTEFYKQVAEAGDTIISIHITSKLSGTYESAVAAARELKDTFNVIPFDSMCGSVGIGMLCREARLAEREGLGVEDIIKRIEGLREKIDVYLTLDTLEYARMSGRVGAMQAALASLLNVKPIATLGDGVISITEKVRTRSASIERLINMAKDKVGDNPINLAVVHARDPKSGQALLDKALGDLNVKESDLVDLSISIAANLGPGTVGLIFYPVSE